MGNTELFNRKAVATLIAFLLIVVYLVTCGYIHALGVANQPMYPFIEANYNLIVIPSAFIAFGCVGLGGLYVVSDLICICIKKGYSE